jgi:mannose-6-phosphate isomerase-like protein (cupin superfamily)
MAYKSSPRPVFDRPTAIPYASVTRHLWGDEEAGLVSDWIYVSSDKIHQLVFGLPPGQGFTHSDSFRTIFAADEVLHVVHGTMVIANPETGEVKLVRTGEAVFFRRDTWHNAWAFGSEELKVLEFFAPPPSTGTSGKYAQTKPYVDQPKYERAELWGKWPSPESSKDCFAVLREPDLLWSVDKADARVITGLFASTDQLTSGRTILSPGGRSAPQRHGGALGLYVTKGRLNILVEEPELPTPWFELHPGDGFYVPQGSTYRVCNMSGDSCEYLFGVAPAFREASAG